MASRDELRAIRRELDDLVGKARVLASRIEELERQDRQQTAEPPKPTPTIPKQPEPLVEPPPLPAHITSPKEEAPPTPSEPPKPQPPRPQPAKPAPVNRLRAYIESRVDTTQQGWEIALATYVLPRIGILVLTIAVVLGLTMAANQGGPAARVALGYAAAGVLLGLAAWLESRYRFYARVLFSGGFTLSYFVTFATHYIEYARVIDSEAVTLALLTIVVIAWAAFAQWRQSRIMAVLVTALGHFTFTLSVLTEEDLGNYPVAGLVLLAAGSAFFLLRNRWYYVAWLGIVGSYANHFLWMANAEGGETPFEFWASFGLVASYFTIFALSELFSHEDVRREKVPTAFRTFFVTLNTACFFGLASITVSNFPFSETEQDLFRYILAAVLFGIGFAYLHLRDRDPLFNAYITKGVVVFSLGLGFTFGDNALSTALAIEAAALLISARRSGLVVTRVLAFLVAAVACLQAAATLSTQAPIYWGAEGFNALAFQAAATVFALLLMTFVYTHTDWTRRLPKLLWMDQYTRATLARFNFCEPPPNVPVVNRPFDGLLFAYVYAAAAALLFVPYASVLIQNDYAMIALALGALVATAGAALLHTVPFGLTTLIVTAAAAGISSLQWLDVAEGRPETTTAILALTALAATALATERWLLKNRTGLAIHQSELGPYFFYGAVAIPLGLFLNQEFNDLSGVIAIAIAAIAFAAAYTALHPGALAVYAATLFIWSALHGLVLDENQYWPYVYAALVAISLAGDRFFAWSNRGPTAHVAGPIILVAGWLVALRVAAVETPEVWFAHAVIGIAFGYMIYAAGFRSIPGAAVSVLTAIGASFGTIVYALDEAWAVTPMSLAFGLCAIYWIALEREDAYAGRRLSQKVGGNTPIHGIFIAAAVALGVIALERIPQLADFYLTVSWAVLAFGVFAISAITREKFYRYAGLAVLALALGRAFLHDALNLEGIQRVAAFGVLGIVLLAVAFGYIYAMGRLNKQDEPT